MNDNDAILSQLAGIVVCGDITIDCLEVSLSPQHAYAPENDEIPNWQTNNQLRTFELPGEALLMARFLQGTQGESAAGYDETSLPVNEAVRSYMSLERFPVTLFGKDRKDLCFRIKHLKGFSGPISDLSGSTSKVEDDPDAQLIVIDDAGNGFRNHPDLWPKGLMKEHTPLVLHKMGKPIARGKLWHALMEHHPTGLLVVVNADDLRREGVNISRKLSWERTATDCARELATHPLLVALRHGAYLVVRFGIDGAILFTQLNGNTEARLFFDPRVGEDGSLEYYPGIMRGLGTAFAIGLALELHARSIEGVSRGIHRGLKAARRLLRRGYGTDPDRLDYPGPELFELKEGDESVFVEVSIPTTAQTPSMEPPQWCIVNDRTPDELEQAALDYVLLGKEETLRRFPIAEFGSLRTVERLEIEAYRAIENLIREYLSTPATNRPISVAVFGAPGSGKSFGVTQVGNHVAAGRLQKLEFNLSQFNTPDELVSAFHRIRDVVPTGKIPFVFFDEFDTEFHGPLGWLKYFLAPMQAGTFKDQDINHPIGRGIFVFAGGTCSTFAEFCRETHETIDTERSVDHQGFRDAKGPDFVSRLRGYVNVKGIDQEADGTPLYMIRRALLLRYQLKQKASHLFSHEGRVQIDPCVLCALLKVSRYKHGVRSLSAIIDMSMLSDRKRFERASLPSSEQLELHVNAADFMGLVMRGK